MNEIGCCYCNDTKNKYYYTSQNSWTFEKLHNYFLRASKKDDYLLITLRNLKYMFKGKLISAYLDDVLTINIAPF